MAVNPDFRDLFAALNGEGAEFLIVGAHALAIHGAPRFTKDLDVWVRPTEGNAQKVFRALQAFGAPLANLSTQDLHAPDVMFQIGIAPNRIDLLTAIDGVDFDACWGQRLEHRYGDQPVWIIGKADLIRNKVATGRPQDLVDVSSLRNA
jgi:hypothetical protein